MINSIELKYFIEIANTQHVSRAAERLGVTQPTLSHSIKRLEESIGADLFIRSKKGVTLTPAGKRLYSQAQLLQEQWQQVIDSVHDEEDAPKGIIRLGVHSAVAQYTLPLVLPKMTSRFPDIKFNLSHDLSRRVTEAVISSHLDVAIAVNPVAHNDLIIKEICKDIVTLWKPKNISNEQVLMYDDNLLQAQDIIRKLENRKMQFNNHMHSGSLETIAQLLKAGVGYAILPKRVVQAFQISGVEKVEDAPVFQDRICLVYKQEFRKTKRGQIFIENVSGSF
ncbi:MAG: LysR family transcriptional regulator [Pseudobdellovibrio sp.]